MRSLAAAAAVPQMATDMILRAEEWEGKPQSFIVPPQWENMDAKFGKELKKVITDSIMNRTISTMEEKSLRKNKRQLSGMAIYITIFRHFKRDEKLAKPQAYEELQECVYENNLGQFISK